MALISGSSLFAGAVPNGRAVFVIVANAAAERRAGPPAGSVTRWVRCGGHGR
jgi:hypothetical protein